MKSIPALIVSCCLLAAPAAARAWSAEDMVSTARIPAAVPSPDGERIAYVVERADLETDISAWRSALHVAAADGSERRRFTSRDARVSHPRWSPDGQWIGYLRARADAPAQLMVIPLDGGAPRQLTDFAEGVQDFRWSPRGNSIALLRTDPADTEPHAAGNDAEVSAGPAQATHLWWLAFDDGEALSPPRRLTGGDFQVGNALLGAAFDWSPDGRRIVFTRVRGAGVEDWTSADLALVDVGSGQVRAFQQSDAAEFDARFSPDGKHIAFSISLYPPSWIRQSRIGLARADGSGLKLLAVTPDQQPELLGWLSDQTLLVRETHRTTTSLWTLPIDGGAPRRFDDGAGVLESVTFNEPGTRLAFVASSAQSPPEAATTTLRRFRPVTVSRANASAPALPAAETRVIRWASADGAEIEGLLTLPTPSTGRAPLVLLVHGGPAGTFVDDYLGEHTAMMPVAALAGRGYATLRPNPRGSSGYGYDFRAAVRGDLGGVDYQDLMSGVEHLVAEGIADPERLGIAGWSYGGYLSAWATTRSHRFGAAVAGAPIADLATLSVTTDAGNALTDLLGGSLWQRRELYLDRSPLLHADRSTTPTLVLHGEADVRVPPTQGLLLHSAVQDQGIETRLVRYPRAPHALDEPRQLVHMTREMLAWFDRHL